MLTARDRQKNLLSKFRFILIVFLSTLFYILYTNNTDNNANNTLMNISISLIAWSFVAIIELIIDISGLYKEEKNMCYKYAVTQINKIQDSIKSYINQEDSIENIEKSMKENTPVNETLWRDIIIQFDNLEDLIKHLPERQKIYILSNEYKYFCGYINRCYNAIHRYEKKGNWDFKELFDTFFEISTSYSPYLKPMKSDNFLIMLRNNLTDVKHIDLAEDNLLILDPERYINKHNNSIIRKRQILVNEHLIEHTELKFKPYSEIKKIISKNTTEIIYILMKWFFNPPSEMGRME